MKADDITRVLGLESFYKEQSEPTQLDRIEAKLDLLLEQKKPKARKRATENKMFDDFWNVIVTVIINKNDFEIVGI